MKARYGIAIVLAALFCLLAAAPAFAAELNPYEQQLLAAVNQVRSEHHLRALTVSDELSAAARAHSADMGQRQYFAHDTLGGASWSERLLANGYGREGYRSWKVGENIAWGAGLASSPLLVVDGWMHSPLHRAVLLTKSFREVGLGAVAAEGYGEVEGTVWFFTLDAGNRSK